MVMKICLSGEGQYLILEEILVGLKLNFQQFQNVCIVAGCDHVQNIRGVAIHRAYAFVSKNKLFSELKNKDTLKHYKEHFKDAKAVFVHQTVFDVETLKTVPLHAWESDEQVSMETKILCGRYLKIPNGEKKNVHSKQAIQAGTLGAVSSVYN